MKSRGTGSLYHQTYRDRTTGEVRQSAVWWIQYFVRGTRKRESSHSTVRAEASRLLRRRLGEVGQGRVSGAAMERTTFAELEVMLLEDYRANNRRSLRRAEQSLVHLGAFFGLRLAVDIHEGQITRYIRHRREEGAANGTINRELAALKRAFRLADIAQMVARVPHISLLKEAAPRKGFFEADQFERVLQHLPERIRPVIEAAYITGWRVRSEILTRRWQHVDFAGAWLRLDPGETKNDEGRSFALTPALKALLDRQRAYTDEVERRLGKEVPWVFHREGIPIHYFRRAWITACDKAGLARRIVGPDGRPKVVPQRIPHDFRRTAVRNLARVGVDRKTAMEMVGHKTESIYRRYLITDEAMLKAASARLAALHEAERERNSHSSAIVEGVLEKGEEKGPSVTPAASETKLVAWDGIEPPTRGFSVRCSTS